jgi:hypothetical protein
MDPSGGCPHAGKARLLAQGAVARVVLPGEIEGMAVLAHDALKEFLAHPDVAFTRFPALELAVPEQELARHAGFVGNSVRALPVRLRPGRSPAVRSGADA